jgi:hypothetical protein
VQRITIFGLAVCLGDRGVIECAGQMVLEDESKTAAH